jgi:quercetin dioxygenase-like cupin family protein
MPFIEMEALRPEYVTPKHSTAFGRLITGTQVELGVLRYKAGEGAKTHAHPHEQILLLLSGRARATIGDDVREIGPGIAVHIPPDVPHSLELIEDSEVVSCKGIVGGVGHRI